MHESSSNTASGPADGGGADIRRLNLRPHGMFSNVNEVVEHLRLAEADGYRFVIDWSTSCYRDPDRPGDPWRYYFEPCFPGTEAGPEAPLLPTGASVACTRGNIITPRLKDGECNPLLLPRDRAGAHRLIVAHIRLNGALAARIAAFRERYFAGPVVGLHIRGPGRTDGGVPELRRRHAADGTVPLDLYFARADAALAARPQARLFACSDSSAVIDAIARRYGKQAVFYDATRSAFGEMHANHPENSEQRFSPYTLGEDVVLEAYLLAQTDFLVHGNSNVANFVLCLAPDLLHEYVYA